MSSVIPVQDLDSNTNHYASVISRGFSIGDTGLYFPCGITNASIDSSSGETMVLVSKVAIRRTETLRVD